MTKALFFDIDGTLVSFHTHRIPSSTIEALEQKNKKTKKKKNYRTSESHYQQSLRATEAESH